MMEPRGSNATPAEVRYSGPETPERSVFAREIDLACCPTAPWKTARRRPGNRRKLPRMRIRRRNPPGAGKFRCGSMAPERARRLRVPS